MASSKLQTRPYVDKAMLLDLGLICGVVLGYHFGIRPVAEVITDKASTAVITLMNCRVRVPSRVRRSWNALLEAYRMHQRRGSLVRTIAYYVPFLPKTHRVDFGRYWNDEEYERVLGGTALSNLKKLFHDDSYYSDSDGDSDCGAAAGLIYDYGPEIEDLNMTENFEDSRFELGTTLWGTTDLTYNFEKDFRPIPNCSTPNIPRKFDPLDDLRSVSEVSECNVVTQAKVAALENELTEMRAMIAKILASQNPVDATIVATTDAALPEPVVRSGQSSFGAFVPVIPVPPPLPPSVSAPPPPPPPPPPPMPNLAGAGSSAVAAAIKLRVNRKSLTDSAEGRKASTELHIMEKAPPRPTTIVDVLKDLPSVKLRSIAKSPGGTPLRQAPKTPNRNDPASLIAAALRTRFARMHSPGSEVEFSDDEFDDKENVSFGATKNENDGFSDNSPLKPLSGNIKRKSDKTSLGISVVCNNARKSLEAAMTLDHVNFPETY